jgi:tetratricopeptide (TPR) repeat protein
LLTQAQRILNGDPVGLGKTYMLLSGIETFLGKSVEALNHLNQALSFFEQHSIKNEVANVCCNLGDLYLKRSEYASARPLLMRSCELAEEIGLAPIMSVALGNLGVLSARLGNLTEAETRYRQALNISEQVGDPFYTSLLQSYVVTALIEQGKLNEAEPLLLQSLKISHSRHIAFCTGFALTALGHLRFARAFASRLVNFQGNNAQEKRKKNLFKNLLLKAQATFQRALTFEGLEADIILDGQLSLAEIAFHLDEIDNACSLATKALEEAHTGELVWLQARAQSLLGQILAAAGKYSLSESYFHKALSTFSNTDMLLEQARTSRAYGITLLKYSKESEIREKALGYIERAKKSFLDCHANLELESTKQLLVSPLAQALPAVTNVRKSE